MIDSASSDLIQRLSVSQNAEQSMQLLHFRDGKILVLSEDTVAFYKDESSMSDALGTGLIAMAALDKQHHLQAMDDSGGWVKEYKAGFVGLHDDKAILITPLAIQLFAHRKDALYNRNEIARLDIPA